MKITNSGVATLKLTKKQLDYMDEQREKRSLSEILKVDKNKKVETVICDIEPYGLRMDIETGEFVRRTSDTELYKMNDGTDGSDKMMATFKVPKNYTAKETGVQAWIYANHKDSNSQILRVLEVRNGKVTKTQAYSINDSEFDLMRQEAEKLKSQGRFDLWYHSTTPAVIDKLIPSETKNYFRPFSQSIDRMDGLSDEEKLSLKKSVLSAMESTGGVWNNDPSKIFQVEQGKLKLEKISNYVPKEHKEDFLKRVDGFIDTLYLDLAREIQNFGRYDKSNTVEDRYLQVLDREVAKVRNVFMDISNNYRDGNEEQADNDVRQFFAKIKSNPALVSPDNYGGEAMQKGVHTILNYWHESFTYLK